MITRDFPLTFIMLYYFNITVEYAGNLNSRSLSVSSFIRVIYYCIKLFIFVA